MSRRDSDKALLAAARAAAKGAYAPYSKFRVGAALRCADGTIVTGCNVENASYGLSTCAERVAVGRAVAEGHRTFEDLAIVALGRAGRKVRPCGACRQVLAEFAPALRLVMADGVTSLDRLLPDRFVL